MQDVESFWTVVGKGAAIIGVIVAIIQGIKYLYAETPTAKLEKKVEDIMKKMENDYVHLQRHDREILELQKKADSIDKQIRLVNDGITKIGKSNISILRHMIDGNGADKMKDEVKDLTEFFIDR